MIELRVEDAPSATLEPDQAQVIRAVSPTIDAERTDEGALLTIHDIDGTKEINLNDGEKGDRGEPGQDGLSPTATVTQTETGALITVTDADGTTTAEIKNGENGEPGVPGAPGVDGADGVTFTPAVSAEGVISWSNDGGRTNPQPVNIKGAKGDTGEKGDPGDDYILTAADKAEIAQQAAEEVDVPVQSVNNKTGAVVLDAQDVGAYEKPASGIPASDLADGVIPAVPVQDVQVNGVSVLQDGVANVPVANDNGTFGVVGIYGSYATGIGINSDGYLSIRPTTNANVKAGNGNYMPVTSAVQHASTFYGLCKAAGADMASSSNPVGQYTDAAKDKIMKMIGILDMIAPYESTGVASRAYSIGDCFIQGGKLYRATAAISIGVSFSSSNCEQTTLIAEITR